MNLGQGQTATLTKFDVTIDGESIIQAVTAVNLWQDITSLTWLSNIHVSDTSNVVNNLKVVAGSKVKIIVESTHPTKDSNESFEYETIVNAITDRVMLNEQHTTFTIECIDVNLVNDFGKKITKAYKGKKAEEILKTVLPGTVEEFTESTETFDFIASNWTNFTIASSILKSAKNKNGSDYILFQSDIGKWKFLSLEEIYKNPPKEDIKFIQRHQNIMTDSGDFDKQYLVGINEYGFSHMDGLLHRTTGGYANTLLQYDIIKKKWISTKHVNEHTKTKTWKDSFNDESSHLSFIPIHNKVSDGTRAITETADSWYGSRKCLLAVLDSDKLAIQIPGNVYWINKILGTKVKVDLLNQEDMTGERKDVNFNGDHIVTNVHFHFRKDIFLMNIEMIKKHRESM